MVKKKKIKFTKEQLEISNAIMASHVSRIMQINTDEMYSEVVDNMYSRKHGKDDKRDWQVYI